MDEGVSAIQEVHQQARRSAYSAQVSALHTQELATMFIKGKFALAALRGRVSACKHIVFKLLLKICAWISCTAAETLVLTPYHFHSQSHEHA